MTMDKQQVTEEEKAAYDAYVRAQVKALRLGNEAKSHKPSTMRAFWAACEEEKAARARYDEAWEHYVTVCGY